MGNEQRNCIFCNKQFDMLTVDAEHIIPRNVGGTVVTYQVCNVCNKKLSRFDAELNRQGEIYSAYKEIQSDKKPPLEFRFKEAALTYNDSLNAKMIPKSTVNEIITTEIRKNEFVCSLDAEDKCDPFIGRIYKIQKKYKIPVEFIQRHLQPYREFRTKAVPGSVYHERTLTNMDVEITHSVGKYEYVMSKKTPHRFLAKACVEYAHLLGFQDKIVNLPDIAEHALNGGLEGKKLFFYIGETDMGCPSHFHTILFTTKQFTIYFFGKKGFSIEIKWKKEPFRFIFANDILNKTLVLCREEKDQLISTNEVFLIHEHQRIGRRTHIT
ncbi:HNH endonuclease [Chitinispirillales bacterium ANBcel5]|uniref:HNH endonuclease n=1 Tax=Cellulosispirillum alkaliphilum TaxID=3039283 RepID=UPI002A540E0C|nr:HNH endonuclease [Chitinispirillales bacterium ANBcel5]